MNFLPPGFFGDFLSGFVVNIWIATAALSVGLTVGGILAWLQLRGGMVGRCAAAATSLCDTVPTFIAMFVLLHLLTAWQTTMASPTTCAILALAILSTANSCGTLVKAIRFYRDGANRDVLRCFPDTARLFVVLLLGSTIGAAIGVPDAVTATLRYADLLPDIHGRIVLVIVALALFMLIVQAIEALLRIANTLLFAIVLPSAATEETDDPTGQNWRIDIESHLRFMTNHRVLVGVAVGIGIVAIFGAPTPPRTVAIATGATGGSWSAVAEKYRPIFAAQGIELRSVPFENTASIPTAVSLDDGIVSMGFAITEIRPSDAENLRTLGAIEYQPLFVFYRKALGRDWTAENLRGRTVALPPTGSATVALAVPVLNALGIDASNTKISYMPLADQVAAIQAGTVDAIAAVLRDDNPIVRDLMQRDDLQLIDFPQAYAISLKFPQLRPVKLARDVIDMAKHIPARDISLVAHRISWRTNRSIPRSPGRCCAPWPRCTDRRPWSAPSANSRRCVIPRSRSTPARRNIIRRAYLGDTANYRCNGRAPSSIIWQLSCHWHCCCPSIDGWAFPIFPIC